jgi:dipeptide transport system substrate-binding protein
MTLPTAADRDLAAVLAESWRAVGVETTVVPVDRAVFAERLAAGDFAAAIHRFTGGNQFTTIFKGAFHSRSIHDLAGTRGELNYARYADPALDALVDAADAEMDRERRRAAYAEVQRRVAEAVPWILLWHPDTIAVASARVGPFEPSRGGDFTFVRTLSVR